MGFKLIDVFIVNYNTAHLFAECFGRVKSDADRHTPRILLVDNASTQDAGDLLNAGREIASVFVQNAANVGFGRANNQLIEHVQAPYVLLLNTDAFVSEDTLAKTLAFMEATPDCGVLGVKLTGREGDLQPSCRYFPTPLNVFLSRTGLIRFFPWVRPIDDMAWGHDEVRECDWVPGCYYLIRREVLDQVGLFDPRYFLYYEEVDHCKRVKAAGWKVIYYPHTQVVHIGGESAKSAGNLSDTGRQLSALQTESELLYFRKHHGLGGLALHLCLQTVADAYLAFKALVKGKGAGAVAPAWRNMSLMWRLWRQTGFATRPTR